MKGWPIFAVGLGVFFFHFGGYWSATWWSKWTFLGIAFSIVFASWASSKIHWTYLPLMLWSLLNATGVAFCSTHFPHAILFRGDVIQALEKNALYALLFLVASMWTFASFSWSWRWAARNTLAAIWLMGTAAYLVIPNLPDNGWYFGNPSMGASLLACLLPTVWDIPRARTPLKILTWLLTAWAIHRTHTAIPVGVLGIVTVAYTYDVRYYQAKWLPWTFFPGIGALFLLSGKHLLDTNGRSPIWQLMWNWTRSHHLLWTGTGAGSVEILTPILQVQYGVRLPDFFIWLHSDWLQVLIEYGWLGLACALLAFSRLSWKAVQSGKAGRVASLMGFAALGLFGYPLRMPIHFFCLLLLCCLIESKGKIPPTQAAS